MPSQYKIGVGKFDIKGPAAELGMMGMSSLEQKTEGILFRLFSRAFIICENNGERRAAIVNADLWSCTVAIKIEVVKRLREEYGDLYNLDNVLISGTHTHSGPGGYSYYALYNLSILGFDKQNFEAIVNGIVKSIESAHKNLTLGTIYVKKDDDENCGGNRSPYAYKNNPEDERNEYKDGDKECDTDKEMLLLKFVKEDGTAIGEINWFAIHPTSMGEKNKLINGDNKGYASYLFEKDYNITAAFANSTCGDVSGNAFRMVLKISVW